MSPADRHPILHRWFVQYNPTLLISATLVLAGVIALSDGLARDGTTVGQLGITAIAESYAWALIGSAALLVRMQLRRPATMLAYLALVYCSDPTLHTATCTHLGVAGLIGSAVWGASFILKLRALAWAMRLELSRSAWLTLATGGLGVTAMPWLLLMVPPKLGTAMLWSWAFSVLATGLWTSRLVVSDVPLDAWPATVARRSMHWIWIGLSAVLLGHTLFWATRHAPQIDGALIVPVMVLLATRFCATERATWFLVATTLGAATVVLPSQLWLVALLGAATLGLRALRRPVEIIDERRGNQPASPYRILDVPPRDAVLPVHAFATTEGIERVRLLVGAAACLHLSTWFHAWSGGALLPQHLWPADLVLLGAGMIAAWRLRTLVPTAPGAVVATHALLTSPWLPTPQSTTQWGATSIIAGFALLAVSVFATIRLAHPRSGLDHERAGP